MNTEEYMKSVRKHLKKTYGSINDEWSATLDLLKDNLDLYNEIKDVLKREGLYDPVTHRRNTLLSSLKDLQSQILTISRHLGLSPYSQSKIKKEIDDDVEDFIDNLTS